jgi:hypothetical protein
MGNKDRIKSIEEKRLKPSTIHSRSSKFMLLISLKRHNKRQGGTIFHTIAFRVLPAVHQQTTKTTQTNRKEYFIWHKQPHNGQDGPDKI